MKRRTVFIVLLIMIILFVCGTALAGGQTNPRRKHVEETIEWKNEKQIPGLFRASGPSLAIICDTKPTLAAPGRFTVTVNNGGDYADWRYEYGITDTGRDPDGYIFFSAKTDSNIFEDFVFYTAGDYELVVFLYRKDDLKNHVAIQTYSFKVKPIDDYPTLEEKAQGIVSECRVAGKQWQTALNLHNWLTHHIYYDKQYEYYGADVLFRGKGVCDSYSKAFKLLCNTAGIAVERVTSSAQNHAWNVIQFDDVWYQVDVTWDDPSGATEAVSGQEHCEYYCLSDDVMFLDHTRYDVTYDPGCPSMAMNYHIKTNTWQTFGKYNERGDTIEAFFLNAMSQGYANPEFYLGDWEWYYPGNGYGYAMSAVRYEIYVAGLRQKNWMLGEDPLKVNIQLNHADRFVSLDARWDIPETGILTLPPIIKSIGDNAFEQTNATTVIIPDGCTKIGAEAFKDSSVRTMDVPASVTIIADNAIDGCKQIIFILHEADSDFAESVRQKGHLVAEP